MIKNKLRWIGIWEGLPQEDNPVITLSLENDLYLYNMEWVIRKCFYDPYEDNWYDCDTNEDNNKITISYVVFWSPIPTLPTFTDIDPAELGNIRHYLLNEDRKNITTKKRLGPAKDESN